MDKKMLNVHVDFGKSEYKLGYDRAYNKLREKVVAEMSKHKGRKIGKKEIRLNTNNLRLLHTKYQSDEYFEITNGSLERQAKWYLAQSQARYDKDKFRLTYEFSLE